MTVSGQTVCWKEGALPESFPLKPKETFPTLEAECSISHPANSLSVVSEIFPLTQAERQSQSGASYCRGVAKCHRDSPRSQKTADNIN